jgi:SPP1 family predicted phage head-tail adaptor
MRSSLVFERQSTTQDSVGQLQNVWSEVFRRMGSVEPLNGREYFSASGENSEVTTRIRVRYDQGLVGIKPYDRIVSGGVSYDILSVINPSERNQELVFMAKRSG